MCELENRINPGDYVLIERQGYMKLHKLKEKGTVVVGKFTIEYDNVIGQKFFELFQMKPKGKKMYSLEKVTEIEDINQINIEKSGMDNRDITDDGNSQTLSKEEIENLQEESSSTEILGKLIANSKTFNNKTEYSQEKYLKKKQKKYFDYIRVRKPTIRLLAEMFFKNDPTKTLGMRVDDLSQILSYANINSDGVHLLYDSGTNGLVPAALINAIGEKTQGKLIHIHPGNEWQKTALLAMQFPKEQSERCIHVNIYSVIRWYHQNFKKGRLIEVKDEESADLEDETNPETKNGDSIKRKLPIEDDYGNEKKRPCWHFDNENASKLLEEGLDSMIIVSKEDPVNIFQEFQEFLKPSRNVVVFSHMKEALQELYLNMRKSADFINVMVVNSFMRHYQILPDRTHPMVNMNFGGYILYATKIKT